MSDDEVQRRVAVEGGVSAKPAIERAHPVRRRPPRRDRARARDWLLLLGLVAIGLVAVTIMLPKGPLIASSTNPPGSQVAAASAASTITPIATPSSVLITLPPSASESPAAQSPTTEPTAPVITAPPSSGPTPAPTRAPTLPPGPTPSPTPRPTRTPTPTAKPTPTLTPTAKLAIKVALIKDDGGNAALSSFTVNVSSAGTAMPSSFTATSTGTNVTITAGEDYSVTVNGPSGYIGSFTADCSSATGGLPPAGSTQTCTVIRNDIKPRLTVDVNVSGGTASPGDWTVTVSGTAADPGSFAGSSAGTLVRVGANAAYDVGTSGGPSGYQVDASDPDCSGSLVEGASASCSVMITADAPPTGSAPLAGLAPLVVLIPGSRRWRTIQRR